MSRLIDADELTEKLKEWLKDKETSRGRGTAEEIWCNDAEIDILKTIIDDISNMPTEAYHNATESAKKICGEYEDGEEDV